MKSFWLFRTNLRPLEYYHKINTLERFKRECHDFYLLQGIWFLENGIFDEVVVWRLRPNNVSDFEIVFEVNGKKFIQRFVNDFNECFYYPSPQITFFRGGFPEYAKLTSSHATHFGLKLYYGAGRRIQSRHGGVYDKILVEDQRDYGPNTIPFYKTANPNIFYPMYLEKKFDICWPCNFAQLKYKGQEWFIKQVAASGYLKSLKILHVGNNPNVGKELSKKYKVNNIEYKGWVSRPELNKYLNQSKIGLVTSNEQDGSPRVITEILCSGIALLKRRGTRVVQSYSNSATLTDYNTDKENKFKIGYLSEESDIYLSDVSMDSACQKNLELWKSTTAS